MFDPKLKEALSRVQKPGRYTGGEPVLTGTPNCILGIFPKGDT